MEGIITPMNFSSPPFKRTNKLNIYVCNNQLLLHSNQTQPKGKMLEQFNEALLGKINLVNDFFWIEEQTCDCFRNSCAFLSVGPYSSTRLVVIIAWVAKAASHNWLPTLCWKQKGASELVFYLEMWKFICSIEFQHAQLLQLRFIVAYCRQTCIFIPSSASHRVSGTLARWNLNASEVGSSAQQAIIFKAWTYLWYCDYSYSSIISNLE